MLEYEALLITAGRQAEGLVKRIIKKLQPISVGV